MSASEARETLTTYVTVEYLLFVNLRRLSDFRTFLAYCEADIDSRVQAATQQNKLDEPWFRRVSLCKRSNIRRRTSVRTAIRDGTEAE